jgi:hypothetical protein
MGGGLGNCPFKSPRSRLSKLTAVYTSPPAIDYLTPEYADNPTVCEKTLCELWDTTKSQCGMALNVFIGTGSNNLVDAINTNGTNTVNKLDTDHTNITNTINNDSTSIINEIDTKHTDLINTLNTLSTNLNIYLNSVLGTVIEANDLIPKTRHNNPLFANIRSDLINLFKHNNADHFDDSKKGLPIAGTLTSENFGREDLDRNNYIYAVDFVIDEYDPLRPEKTLYAAEMDLGEDIKEIPYVSWTDYKNWAYDSVTYTDPVAPAIIWFNRYVLRLVQEARQHVDKDGNGKVFVTDFKFNITIDLPNRLKTYQETSTATKIINFSAYCAWVDGGPDPLI